MVSIKPHAQSEGYYFYGLGYEYVYETYKEVLMNKRNGSYPVLFRLPSTLLSHIFKFFVNIGV